MLKLCLLLASTLSIAWGAADNTLIIKVEQNAIFVDNKKIANTTDVAKQDSLIIKTLKNELTNKKKKQIQIQIDPEQSYGVLFKVAATSYNAGYTEAHITSKIGGTNYNELIFLSNIPYDPNARFVERACGDKCKKSCEDKYENSSVSNYIIINTNECSICTDAKCDLISISILRPYYDEISSALTMLYKHRNASDEQSIIILAENDIKISNIIPTMPEARVSGFPKIHLKMLTESFKRNPPNDIIIQINGERHSAENVCNTSCISRGGHSRSSKEIKDVINARTPELKEIYRNYFKKKPDFGGKITLKFSITGSGEIININVVSSTTAYPEFDKAIRNAVRTWKWSAIERAKGYVTPTIPFNFTEEMLSE